MCHRHYRPIPEGKLESVNNPTPMGRAEGVSAQSTVYSVPIIQSDELHGAAREMDWAAGRSFDSKSERRRYYKDNDLKRTSIREAQNEGLMGDHPSLTKKYNIPGVKKRQGLPWQEQVV
jgi:hypothetical protein